MKIEKINDNQIRCTLYKEDLSKRNLKLSELAFGSGKAKDLFRDMMQQANEDFGFEINDRPLMVEAIPVSMESIILVITKVDDPSETEEHASKFFSPEAKAELLARLKEIDIDDEFEALLEEDDEDEDFKVVDKTAVSNEEDSLLYSIYTFDNLNELITVSKLVIPHFKGDSSVFKSPYNNRYYLSLCVDSEDESSMIKVCSILTEHGVRENPTYAKELFFIEHFKEIISENAIEKLAKI